MAELLQYGGQAVIEGVMMRSPRFFAVACRKPDGVLVVQEEALGDTILGRLRPLDRPFLRGTLALIDALALGLKALAFSANVQVEAEDQQKGLKQDRAAVRVRDGAIGATLLASLALGAGLFVALPTALTQLVQERLGADADSTRNLIDGVIRVTIFFGYILAISTMQNIRRVFQYHGAEHKAINTLESGQVLTLENALRSSRIHPRCGTSFIVVVLIATVLVHSLFPRPDHALVRIGLHLALLPLVAGASYELIRWAGRSRNALFLRVLLAPGLWSQAITTREPTSDQVEVALAALTSVRERETAPQAADASARTQPAQS